MKTLSEKKETRMIKTTSVVVCGFALGFAALALEACSSKSREITMTMVRGLPDKAPAPIINKGDVLTWTAGGKQIDVEFDYVSPCTEGVNKMISSCTVNVPSGMFSYVCEMNVCPDPEVPVGSDVHSGTMYTARATNPTGYRQPVPVYCNNNMATAAPQVATAGQSFNWLGEGSPQPEWTATLRADAAGVCSATEGLNFNPDKSKCTVQPGHTGAYTYDLTVTGCTTSAGTGSLTITTQ
jgi:hypothetical protein